jgi:molybdenum cofactor synthesis domain-containing protein
MRVWIISIGNELLIGKVVNTNASWLAKKLTVMGFRVERIVSIPDDEEVIIGVFREAIDNADIVISTGGLGPTFDDKTSEALAKALNRRWVLNEDAYKEVKEKFVSVGMELTEERLKMAKMPEGAVSLRNSAGVAPGILVRYDNKLVVALPGVPREMMAIFEDELEGILREIAPHKYYVEETVKIMGVPESTLAPYIDKLVKKYPTMYFKSHPKGRETGLSIIELHISTYTQDREKTMRETRRILDELRDIVARNRGKIVEK